MVVIAKIALGALVAYGALCFAMFVAQPSLLFHPSVAPGPPSRYGLADFRDVTFTTADGLTLTGWLHDGEASGGAVLYFYGNADSLAGSWPLLRGLADGGFSVLGVNYRGYAGSQGSPSEEGLYRDADAAFAFLERSAPGEAITVVGRSLGSGVAVDLASRNPIKALVLISPYTSIPDVASELYPFLPVRLLSRYAFASIDKIAKIGAPLLVIHGDRDTSVPLRHGRALFEAAAEPKRFRVFEGQGHNDLDLRRIASEIAGFVGGLRDPG